MATKDELRKLLLKLYNDHGPRGSNGKIVRPATYAKMTAAHIERTWDFRERKIMHKIARALASTKSDKAGNRRE